MKLMLIIFNARTFCYERKEMLIFQKGHRFLFCFFCEKIQILSIFKIIMACAFSQQAMHAFLMFPLKNTISRAIISSKERI